MPKAKTVYQCNDCGAQHPKWSGQCGECGSWNSLVEIAAETKPANPRLGGYAGNRSVVTLLSDVTIEETPRMHSGFNELDRVLGGGLVQGSVILIGGDPGIGKSTILLQTLSYLKNLKRLYVTGEESPQQIRLRAERLQLEDGGLKLYTETSVEQILETAKIEQPEVMVIDSVQTIFTETLNSAPGSVSQVREATARLVRYAKQSHTTIFIVGHVTKEGQLAGPRVLEHMVDTVLYFEGDSGSRYRVIRAVKNRFGAVNELGVFAMSDKGLKGVNNPSALFLSRHETPVPGSVITVTREGTRPLLVEVQALVDECHGAHPKRVTVGLEQNRLGMLLAVLNRHGGITMNDQDVFTNVVGGVRVTETAADLPILLAALSSFRNRPLSNDLFAFGEIGLAGEIRPVPNGQERLAEAAKQGFKIAIIPKANAPKKPPKELEIRLASRLEEVLDLI